MKALAALFVLGACPARSPAMLASPDAPDAAVATDAPAVQPRSWRQQVLYLAIPDRFANGDPSNDDATHCHDAAAPKRFHGGDLAGLRAHLPDLAALGVTALWITPPNLQAGPPGTACGYHGYWIDYTDPADDALEPELGTPADLAGLSDDLHARGMKLVLDMVVNHAGDSSRIPREHPDWFHAAATCAQLGPAQVYCPLDAHPDFAQEKPEVAGYLSALEARAVARYGLDGIRMDTAKHVPAAYFAGSFFPAVRGARADLWAVAEIFDEGSTAQFPAYLDAGFDSAFHYPLYGALADAIGRGGSVDRVAGAVAEGIARLGPDRALDLVLFVDNHDNPRFANLPGFGVPEDEIRRRMELALTLIFTLPGIPQLYYGDEIGMYGGADPDNRRDLPAWAFGDRSGAHPDVAVAGSDEIYAHVQRLAALRTSEPALAGGAYRELWRQNGAGNPNVFAFERGGRVVVVANNGAAMTMAIPVHDLADGTRLVDALGGPDVVIAGGKLPISLAAKAAAIYRVAQ